MESNSRFYARRAAYEAAAARHALTDAGKARRLQLAAIFEAKARECAGKTLQSA